MSVANPYQQYQQNAVHSASPGDLVLMLYDGLVKFLKIAVNKMNEKNVEGAHNALVRSQEILTYLNEALDHNYELSRNLSALYDFMSRHLLSANVKKDAQMVEEVIDLVQDLRETWQKAVKMVKTQE